MIYIKDDKITKTNTWLDETICVLADFDKTLTKASSKSSWDILTSKDFYNNYDNDVNELYKHYGSIEIDERIDYETKSYYMNEWWNKHINLLIKHKLTENTIFKVIQDKNIMQLRDGIKEFFNNMCKRNIPIIIVSAGLGDIIEPFLKNNDCLYSNVYIISNFIDFKEGIAVGIKDNIIHSLNKNNILYNKDILNIIKDRNNIVLFGDNTSDIKMIPDTLKNNALKIGFLNENITINKPYFLNKFDVVCTKSTSFNDLINKIEILKK